MSEIQEEAGVYVTASRNVMKVVKDIAGQKDRTEAFYVFEVDEVVKRVKEWRHLLPRVRPHYAVKCNNHGPLLEVLAALGCGFDCASLGEIELVMGLGVSAINIILAHPIKQVPHLLRARDLHVSLMTFDTLVELHKIKQHYPAACLVLRIRYDDRESLGSFSSKFGVLPSEARTLLEAAWKLGLNVVGVAFHVGTGMKRASIFYEAIGAAHNVFNEAIELGFAPYLLDLGGGFPRENDQLMKDIAGQITAALTEYFPDPHIQVIAEPGRYMASSAFTLATNVVGRREQRDNKGALTNTHYFINDSIHQSFYWSTISSILPPKVLQGGSENVMDCTVWGQTLVPVDRVAERVLLPPDLDLGAWLVWPSMGAYSLALASDFNGFIPPRVYQVASQQIWVDIQPRLNLLKLQRPAALTSGDNSDGACMV